MVLWDFACLWGIQAWACHPNVCFLFGQHFDMPHDIAASEDGTVYVGDAHTNTVWKFITTESMVLAILWCIFSPQFYCLKNMWGKKAFLSLFIDEREIKV